MSVAGIIFVIVVLACFALWAFQRNNLHFDDRSAQLLSDAGMVEKQIRMPDGALINYGEGPDNGPALVLVHGQSMQWRDYQEVIDSLATRYHVYAVDCFGHGKSTHDAAWYTCEIGGKCIAWFIYTVVRQSCILSGHSSGGVLAAWVAANEPDCVRGLVLEDPPLFRVTPQQMQQDPGCFVWKDSFEVINAFRAQDDCTDYVVYSLQHGYLTSLMGGLKPKLVSWAQQWRSLHPRGPLKLRWVPHSWLHGYYYIDDYDLEFGQTFYDGTWMQGIDQEQMLQRIACPTLYLKVDTRYGKDGVLLAANSDEDAARVQTCIADCKTVPVHKSGHDVHAEKPSLFTAAIDVLQEEVLT